MYLGNPAILNVESVGGASEGQYYFTVKILACKNERGQGFALSDWLRRDPAGPEIPELLDDL